ncbi:MAG: DUF2344 domain-containing protein [Sedimentisphaerales bacterium]|nr:DUF2344 domain-containing protein [Sedimentisphaerales bacterium]
MNQPHEEQTVKVNRATETDQPSTQANGNQNFRLAIWFSVHGDLRYLSHHDTMELWRRLLVRARLPLRFTRGFNPRLRITLPLPRSVGMAADNDLLLVILNDNPSIERILADIQPQCPAGLTVNHAQYIPSKINAAAIWAQYRITLTENADCAKIENALQQFHQADQWPIERAAHGRHKQRTIELKKYVAEIQLRQQYNQNNIWCKINMGEEATPRISEIQQMLDIESPHCVSQVTRLAAGYAEPLNLHRLNETNQ